MSKANTARSANDNDIRLRKLELRCLRYLERARWPGGLRCVKCSSEKVTRLRPENEWGRSRIRYQCRRPKCRRQFSPTTGTIFEGTHLPLFKWLYLIYLSKGKAAGLRASEISHRLKLPYKTAHEMKRTLASADPLSIERLAEPSRYVMRAIVQSPTIRKNFRPIRPGPGFAPIWKIFIAE